MALRTYDPKKVIIVIGGYPMGGFADGEFVNVIRSGDAFSKSVGADGDTTRVKSNDKSGEMTLTLSQTSPSNDVLSGISRADELGNAGVVPVKVKDLSGRSEFVSAFAWIRKIADSPNGKEISNIEWVLDLTDVTSFVGGNLEA